MVSVFFNWRVLILEIIGDVSVSGYKGANILIFVIIQLSLIIIFYLLWRHEKKRNTSERN